MKFLIDDLIQYCVVSAKKFANVPGAVISSLSSTMRESVKQLKSDDIKESTKRKNTGKYIHSSIESEDAKKFKEDKLKFDKNLSINKIE